MDDVDFMCMLCGGDVDDVDLMCMLCGGDVDDVDPQCGVSTCPHLHIGPILVVHVSCPISNRPTQCISRPHRYNSKTFRWNFVFRSEVF